MAGARHDRADVVIVGSGPGGAHTAVALRQLGFAGSILIVTRDSEIPYERPPLSKSYLAGDKAFERILIKPPHFWDERNIGLLLGQAVREVRPRTREIVLQGGHPIAYGHLVWAAGGRARPLSCPGALAQNVHSIRNRADVDALRRELEGSRRRIVVVGGGYIGLEAAAVLTKLGCQVTVLEAEDRVLSRVAGEPLSRFYEKEHRERGVDLRVGSRLQGLEISADRVTGAKLDDGSVLPCDAMIVGIGIVPEVEPLIAAGAVGANGVEVDEFCRTTLAGIFAIGDCAAHRNAFADDAVIRLESVQNATDMATVVAKCIMDRPEPYRALPWFWSDQYDLKLQTVGLSVGADAHVVRGNPDEGRFSVIYLRQGRVVALDCVNSVKDFIQGRQLIEAGLHIAPALLQDSTIPLKELAMAGADRASGRDAGS